MRSYIGQGAIELSARTTTGALVGQGATRSRSGATYRAMLAQGATEYLVLLAVVLIVALVSVALLGFFPGMAADAQMTQSKIYWSSASPIAIIEWGARDIISSNNNLTVIYLRIRNTGVYPISLTKVLANGQTTTDVVTGTWGPVLPLSGRAQLYPGEEFAFGSSVHFPGLPSSPRNFFAFSGNDCASYTHVFRNAAQSLCSRTSPYGTFSVKDFGFEYTQTIEGQTITKRQVGSKPLMIGCMTNTAD